MKFLFLIPLSILFSCTLLTCQPAGGQTAGGEHVDGDVGGDVICFVHDPKTCSEILGESTSHCSDYECLWIIEDADMFEGYSCEGSSINDPVYAKLVRATYIQKLKQVSSGGQSNYVDGQSFWCSEKTRCSCADYSEFSEGGVCHNSHVFHDFDSDPQTDKVLVGGFCPIIGAPHPVPGPVGPVNHQ